MTTFLEVSGNVKRLQELYKFRAALQIFSSLPCFQELRIVSLQFQASGYAEGYSEFAEQLQGEINALLPTLKYTILPKVVQEILELEAKLHITE